MSTPSLLPMPADGVEFNLTLDPIAPLEMVRNDGYDPEDWSHNGLVITTPQTSRFKFVSIGCQPDLNAVIAALKQHGTIPGGQWREAIKKVFKPDGLHPRGIADPSWESPNGRACFPVVGGGGGSRFGWAGFVHGEGWRWLVVIDFPLLLAPRSQL